MKINFNEYKDKVYACWLGKNIGGTMGTPYEGRREFLDIHGFATKPGEVLPNDDLDLQLVWLTAVERYGINMITAARLGEFWLSFITPHWNEYGICKENMKTGLIPPLSGDYHNDWNNSNGAWIRTEIWASLNPGRPDVAMKYSLEDACVDHGSGEGTYAAAFVCAMQSAAFVVSDIRKCIDIALKKIPADTRMAKSVNLALQCYDEKMEFRAARDAILNSNADLGDGWFEAPSNVAYAVLGMLYGEGDFKKSMILAIDCGDDTDCTGATVGATLGILGGTKGIPSDWLEYIGDKIITLSIDRGTHYEIPSTCAELTDRVVKQALVATQTNMWPQYGGRQEATIELTDGESDYANAYEMLNNAGTSATTLQLYKPNSFTVDFNYAYATVSIEGGADIKPLEEKKIHIHFNGADEALGNLPFQLMLRWWLPDGFSVKGSNAVTLPAWRACRDGVADADYIITSGETVQPINRVVCEVTAVGRLSSGYLPIVLMG